MPEAMPQTIAVFSLCFRARHRGVVAGDGDSIVIVALTKEETGRAIGHKGKGLIGGELAADFALFSSVSHALIRL